MTTRRRSDGAALTTVFVLVVVFAYSDDFVEFVLDLFGVPFAGPGPWLVFVLDCLLVMATALLKWRLYGHVSPRRLLFGRWGAGAALVVLTHVVMIATTGFREHFGDTARIWIGIAATLAYVIAVGLLLDGVLGEGSGSRSWLVPMLIGTFAAQVASVMWYPVIQVVNGCGGEISPDYFNNSIQIIPVLLLTLGIELNHLRGTKRTPGARAASALTVILLCVGEALAFTMAVKSHQDPRCGLAAAWHEYLAFVVTAQALAIGLATVAWLLVSIQFSQE